jgi:hypothetical protein
VFGGYLNVSRVERFCRDLYYGWVEDMAYIHPSWSIGSIRELYRRLLKEAVYSGLPNAYERVEELLEQADPSEPIWEFERWAMEALRGR